MMKVLMDIPGLHPERNAPAANSWFCLHLSRREKSPHKMRPGPLDRRTKGDSTFHAPLMKEFGQPGCRNARSAAIWNVPCLTGNSRRSSGQTVCCRTSETTRYVFRKHCRKDGSCPTGARSKTELQPGTKKDSCPTQFRPRPRCADPNGSPGRLWKKAFPQPAPSL